ncbi:MAG: sigma-70 family RNA polymerase sigma factor [Phycisphaerales bacterium]|nr:sigma-70 family RNA polymerase sigma factor [Phycisphaerales bacterium]MCB9857146.1 sigma-70 family RNA polymerase sigma factor [Phycisphaerales bacterium]MCB9861727.1 sigma-70 family RNA polymerase sigma factor [Phycisphaerales bacterium]
MDTTRVSLLLRIRDRQDGVAWREFDAIYRPMLRKFAIAYGADAAEAEDVVQHCMTAIHEHIDQFEYDPSKGRFKGWLKTLVNNRIRNLLRKRRERVARSGEFAATAADDGHDPEAIFEKIWLDEHLRHALKLVSGEVEEKTFKAFVDYVIRERPVEDICADYGLNANQVHKSKYRLTKKLAEKMAILTGEKS